MPDRPPAEQGRPQSEGDRPTAGPDPVTDPVTDPRSDDDRDVGWGDDTDLVADRDRDARWYQEQRPPHWE